MDSPRFRAIRDRLPPAMLPVVRTAYYTTTRLLRTLRYAGAYVEDWAQRSQRPFATVPPPPLRYRVSGMMRSVPFLASGQAAVADLERVLGVVGLDFDQVRDVLDFGCGCGRVLLWLAQRYPQLRLAGCDTDQAAIRWCASHLAAVADFQVNPALPPTSYPSGHFDLIYALSVLTHLDADYQARWLTEWHRLLRPGAYLLTTVHGEAFADRLPADLRQRLHEQGFLFTRDYGMQGIFPDFYQVSYHTTAYVQQTFSGQFEILAHLPAAMTSGQDMVIMRKPTNGH